MSNQIDQNISIENETTQSIADTAAKMIEDLNKDYAEIQDAIDSGEPLSNEQIMQIVDYANKHLDYAEQLAKMSGDRSRTWWSNNLSKNVGSPPGIRGGIDHLGDIIKDDLDKDPNEWPSTQEIAYIAPGAEGLPNDIGNFSLFIDPDDPAAPVQIIKDGNETQATTLSGIAHQVFDEGAAQGKIAFEIENAPAEDLQYEPQMATTKFAYT
ncbi:MAG: hypothetical protein COA45_11510 [Zetaproteobacteria bacterium]|nr:MAG: hypothetical protein COA45_11510 [Zetaproteobacteria bacterium]